MGKKKEIIKLGRKDWIDKGLKVLAESGVEAVRVEPLAKLMNVTKGSFYWHFKNREELLQAILEEWVNRDTDATIEQVEDKDANANAKLLYLLEIAAQDDGKLENAIRAWATNDSKAAIVLAQVDRRRLNYIRDLFLQVGFTPFEAMVRTRMLYYTLVVGEFIIGARPNRDEILAEARLQHAILTHRD